MLEPGAGTAPGTSDVLTVHAASAATAGLENLASLTSVVAGDETTSTSTTSTSTSTSSTSSTVSCTTPRCVIDAALHGPACGSLTVPAAILKKLDRAPGLIEQADSSPVKQARRLRKQAKKGLVAAGKAAGKVAKGKKPTLTAECAGAIQRATGIVVGGLQP